MNTKKMQEKLHEILRGINRFITEINSRNCMVTPFLHSYVQKKRGYKIKYMFSKLADGVHPSLELSQKWFVHMDKVIATNEINIRESHC